ncbi:LemA family protein [Aurantiacibacter aquimixticola]|uniref:LemA family protein n=2 Tax=Aurantiacibacter aquimixticola TaxID=1958945 RepID=A0A419RQR2_9SPHN|nr:LemA family protein [Aurantiacibacter aquimixticola]
MALVIGSLVIASCGINSVPAAEEAAKAQWGNVESALQRRSDLIPGLVEVAQAEAISERNILTEVIDARARATAINITTDDLSNPETFQNFQASQNQLTQALGQLRTVIESYPEISSSAAWSDLRVALDEANNLVNTERVRYNELARDYNTEIRTFPSTIGANIIHGSEPLEYFEASDSENPDVDLSRIIDEGQGSDTPAASNDNTQEDRAAAAN